MNIKDTEEAEFFFDETTCFKSASLLKYLYHNDEESFIKHIKELLMLYPGEEVSFKSFFNYYGVDLANQLFGHEGATYFKTVKLYLTLSTLRMTSSSSKSLLLLMVIRYIWISRSIF
jgi:hypothetical protein